MTPILLLTLSIPLWPVGPQVEELHRKATEQLIERMFQRGFMTARPPRWEDIEVQCLRDLEMTLHVRARTQDTIELVELVIRTSNPSPDLLQFYRNKQAELRLRLPALEEEIQQLEKQVPKRPRD